MKLVRTVDMGGFYIKAYQADASVNPPAFIQNLIHLNLEVKQIKVRESVESDMQNIDGMILSASDFLTQYGTIKNQARDASYEIKLLYQNLPTFITIADESDRIALTTVVQDLDLSEIVKKHPVP